ncbi:hypothetical protein [Streptomyces inhibens]|uniref:hypothetical protein n=1 Tax=Streptomyces inhibens TaxID=2293571 RepID=UPI0015F2666E|nr:hypothetical protein [Streptomyces inhibens]
MGKGKGKYRYLLSCESLGEPEAETSAQDEAVSEPDPRVLVSAAGAVPADDAERGEMP